MVELAGVAALAVGFWIGKRSRRRGRVSGTLAAFRHAAPNAAPYRDAASAVGHPLSDVVAAARAAGLSVALVKGGMVVRRDAHVVEAHVSDPKHVTLAALELTDHGSETLMFELALALVPLFGAIRMTEAMFGTFLVDGSRDLLALVAERKDRITAIAAAIAAQMAEKQAVYGAMGGRL